MDPITHTIIAMGTIIAAYVFGYWAGHNRGSIWGTAVVLEWIEKKVGRAQFNTWMREHEEEQN